ncbi:MAG: OmpA family protein [Myxococcales bacterium]|nr:OmpA family protein [Myxococcales bacterium]MCB9579364.1 OmpA family protein [Polyangiaceae bacterium]
MDLDQEEEEEVEEGAPAWMATFSDMATLLLTFFVLLLSFANMDVQNFRVALGSVKEAFGVQVNVRGDFEGLTTSPVELSQVQSLPHIDVTTRDEDKDELAAVTDYVKKKGLADKIEVVGTSKGIVLRIKDVVLFKTGSDQLMADANPIMETVGELFKRFNGELSVDGHTDNVPISKGRFPSNWELSTARSISVMRNLVDNYQVDGKRVRVAGYADSRPIADNDTPEHRAKNRRVEFLFETPPKKSIRENTSRAFRLPFHAGP